MAQNLDLRGKYLAVVYMEYFWLSQKYSAKYLPLRSKFWAILLYSYM